LFSRRRLAFWLANKVWPSNRNTAWRVLREAAWVLRRNITQYVLKYEDGGNCCSGSSPHLVTKLMRADATPLSGRDQLFKFPPWHRGFHHPLVVWLKTDSFRPFFSRELSYLILFTLWYRSKSSHRAIFVYFLTSHSDFRWEDGYMAGDLGIHASGFCTSGIYLLYAYGSMAFFGIYHTNFIIHFECASTYQWRVLPFFII